MTTFGKRVTAKVKKAGSKLMKKSNLQRSLRQQSNQEELGRVVW